MHVEEMMTRTADHMHVMNTGTDIPEQPTTCINHVVHLSNLHMPSIALSVILNYLS